MNNLKALEFHDAVVDGPEFQHLLKSHEKDLKKFSKRVQVVYEAVIGMFDAMDNLSSATLKVAGALEDCSSVEALDAISTRASSLNDTSSPPFHECLQSAMHYYAVCLRSIEDYRSIITQKDALRKTLTDEIKELQRVLNVEKCTDYHKELPRYYQRLEKYVAVKTKDRSDSVDSAMQFDRIVFMKSAFNHVSAVYKAHQRRQSRFVQNISLLIQTILGFHHQVDDFHQNSRIRLKSFDKAAQESEENFESFRFETNQLKQDLLATPSYKIQPVSKRFSRQGYLFVMSKKSVTTQWSRQFCAYDSEKKTFHIHTRDGGTDQYAIDHCTKCPPTMMDRQFCFELTLLHDKPTTITLQAQSADDLTEWLIVLEGHDPLYVYEKDSLNTLGVTLTTQNIEFFTNLLAVNEKIGLSLVGIYRVGGSKGKISSLLQRGLATNSDPLTFDDIVKAEDPVTVSNAVKQFLRLLTQPLFTFDLYDQFVAVAKDNSKDLAKELQKMMFLLPEENCRILRVLLSHLARVAANSEVNKMNASNLAIIFSPSLLRPRVSSPATIIETSLTSSIIKTLIEASPSTNRQRRPDLKKAVTVDNGLCDVQRPDSGKPPPVPIRPDRIFRSQKTLVEPCKRDNSSPIAFFCVHNHLARLTG